MFYDMAKFQYFFNENKAEVGVEVVPCHALQKGMSSGVSYGEQLVYDIERLKRHFPAVPVKIILIDADWHWIITPSQHDVNTDSVILIFWVKQKLIW